MKGVAMELNTDVRAQVDAAQALYDYFNDHINRYAPRRTMFIFRSFEARRLLRDLGVSLAKVKGEDFDANRRS